MNIFCALRVAILKFKQYDMWLLAVVARTVKVKGKAISSSTYSYQLFLTNRKYFCDKVFHMALSFQIFCCFSKTDDQGHKHYTFHRQDKNLVSKGLCHGSGVSVPASPWRPGSIHVAFVVNKVALGRDFLSSYIQFSPVSIIHHGSLYSYIMWGMNSRLIGGCSSETSSHRIDTNKNLIFKVFNYFK
jgi:hypothetical protein